MARREDLRRFFLARLGGGADIDDLMQELFLKVQGLPGGDIVNPAAYLYRLASNLMLDRMRSGRRAASRDRAWRDTHHATMGDEDIADEPSAESKVIAQERVALINSALTTLAPATQSAFRLHKFEGLSHTETAARLGMSRSAVEKHISLALKHLLVRLNR